MTEADWLAATDPQGMLSFLRETGRVTDRKLRLFAVACCRRVWNLLSDGKSWRAIEVAELFADGLASEDRRQAVWPEAQQAVDMMLMVGDWETDRWVLDAVRAPAEAACAGGQDGGWEAAAEYAALAAGTVMERGSQCDLLRDIFGPMPFRPLPPLAPSLQDYNDRLVFRLAKASYDDRLLPSGHLDPARLAVLCDALLDAGCPADDQILQHLQGEGPHWRGCHALDAIRAQSQIVIMRLCVKVVDSL
jgi:hypothetical protein